MKNSIYFLMILMMVFMLSSLSFAQSEKIIIEVEGLRNPTGNIEWYLFHQADGFPRKRERALKKQIIAIRANQPIRIEMDSLVAGEYALSLLHDENGNGKIDKNFIGMPKEGMGASNNPKSTFGPPNFEQAKFSLESGKTKYLKIKMTYL